MEIFFDKFYHIFQLVVDYHLLKELTVGDLLKLFVLFGVVILIEQFLRRYFFLRLLKRTHLEPSLQYAVGKMIGYCFLALGFYVAFQMAHIDLSSLAIVAGAVGVGLGFGLQNIISNFVSGLIILAERPITLGDRVEVSGVAGQVRKISLRSTTVVTNDNIAIIVPNADFISADRTGIVICDATSAAFAQDLDWTKLDAVTFSWQKALGGEAAHGVLILSPRAVARLESYSPPWPMPKLFRMTKSGKVSLDIFEGATINTPSMLCVEDALDALAWAEAVGGFAGMKARSEANLKALEDWVAVTPWVAFLAEDKAIRSNTSVCLKVVDPAITALSADAQADFAKKLAGVLEKEKAAYDIGGYRDAPPGLRIWCGATVETADVVALTPWLDWAFASVSSELTAA